MPEHPTWVPVPLNQGRDTENGASRTGWPLALSSRQKAAETPNCSTDTSAGSGTARRTVLFTSSIEAEMSEYATSAAMWLGAGASALALEPDIGCCSIGMYSGSLLCHDAASSASQRAERDMHWRARRHAIPNPRNLQGADRVARR